MKHYHCAYKMVPWEVRHRIVGAWSCPVPMLVVRAWVNIPQGEAGPVPTLNLICLN